MRAIVVLLSLLAVSLAGCAESEAPEAPTTVDPDSFQLAAGTGAIAGLVIDDRFRPIAGASVLVHELALQTTASENGEFTFVDVPPGKYTLRVQAEGHEAAPSSVVVEEGVFADANLVARRVFSSDGAIVTQEFAIFIPCNAYATFACPPDMSGDTYRPGIRGNFSALMPDVTYSTWEVLLNNPYIFCFEVRESGGTGASLDRHFGNWCEGQDSTYLKGILLQGEIYEEEFNNDPWDPTADTDAILFTFGNNELTCWEEVVGPVTGNYAKRCAGVGLGIKAQVMVSFFMGDPQVDVESYCILCS